MSTPNLALKALIFDVDGTLADTEEVHRQAFNATFREVGLDWFWTPALYERLLAVSGGRERIARYATEHPGEKVDLSPARIIEIHQQKTARYAALLAAGRVHLRPGTVRLLHEARAAGVKLAIATSSARSNLDTLLDLNLKAGWREWFTVIETSDSVVEKKPSPAVYQAVLRELGLDAAECAAVEDTQNGLYSARAAGLCTVITTHRYTRNHSFPGAALVVDSLGEPDHPPRILHGSLEGERCVTVAVIDRLVASARSPR